MSSASVLPSYCVSLAQLGPAFPALPSLFGSGWPWPHKTFAAQFRTWNRSRNHSGGLCRAPGTVAAQAPYHQSAGMGTEPRPQVPQVLPMPASASSRPGPIVQTDGSFEKGTSFTDSVELSFRVAGLHRLLHHLPQLHKTCPS